ncbi:MAG TPA: hypothetical protein PLU38_08025 [Kiritimatiellia bacterium]|jgi:hypothetical protein|nr:MAG: hypothetical protein BWX70_00187 [Verrucomicrobia bacterium ADurb.Bin070]HPO38133.1 hypothetical protein [Kiritimatiellia bacterium]HQA38247.1 hypothetical protein [Kiritimatiellia bacterium]HQL50958.1 hypothetical protein [Kiritimatiellia bacterium]HQQ91796.1 hypothetical protein [Kiritimatiellia bacterium]
MSDKTTVSDGKRAASDPLAGQAADARYKSFNETADPWKVIGTLGYGDDRTMVSTVERVILDADPSQYPGFEDKLLKCAADPACTEAGYGFICRLLALIASPKSVAALKEKLASGNEVVAFLTRMAIEQVPGDEATAALRAAAGVLKGREADGCAGAVAARTRAR